MDVSGHRDLDFGSDFEVNLPSHPLLLLPLLVQECGHRNLEVELEAVGFRDEVVDQSLGCSLLRRLRLTGKSRMVANVAQ